MNDDKLTPGLDPEAQVPAKEDWASGYPTVQNTPEDTVYTDITQGLVKIHHKHQGVCNEGCPIKCLGEFPPVVKVSELLLKDEPPTALDVTPEKKEAARALAGDKIVIIPEEKEPVPVKERCKRSVYEVNRYVKCKRSRLQGQKFCFVHMSKSKRKIIDVDAQMKLTKAKRKFLSDGRKSPEALVDLTNEMAIIRSVTELLHKEISVYNNEAAAESSGEFDSKKLNVIRQINSSLDTASKIAERIHRINERDKKAVDVQSVMAIVTAVVDVVKEHVKDVKILRKISIGIQGVVVDHSS